MDTITDPQLSVAGMPAADARSTETTADAGAVGAGVEAGVGVGLKPAPADGPARRPAPTTSTDAPTTWKLGRRAPLEVAELPTPEKAFGFRRIGWEEKLLLFVSPAVIAIGVSIGSGEWVLGPMNVAGSGFQGIFWVVLVSILLQVFYNVELGRYTLATGESPIIGFGRIPPGAWLWMPLALISFYMAFILGGWTVSAGQSLLALIVNRPLVSSDLAAARQIGVGLLVVCFALLAVGRKVERTLELLQGALMPYILLGLLMLGAVIVPLDYWGQALRALVVPARPPAGTDISLLGALAGFAALASGLNYMFIGYYRDKGYAMGAETGFISGLLGGVAGSLRPVGKTFAENPANAATWKRWFRMLVVEQWVVYFICVLIGMVVPSVLGGYLSTIAGAPLDSLNAVTFTPIAMGERYGQLLAGWALIAGFVIMFTTQIVVLELLTRNLTEVVYDSSSRVRGWLGDDPRWLYYPVMLVLVVLISVFIHLSLPTQLTVISGNLSNFAAIIFPFGLMYLNSRLPRPARITWWSYLVLAANVIFFGFFFLNFLVLQITGAPLVRF